MGSIGENILDPRVEKKCSAPLKIKEMQIKISVGNNFTLNWQKFKNLIIPSVRENLDGICC